MKTTRISTLALSAALMSVFGWLLANQWMLSRGQGLPVPVMSAMTLWVFGVCLFGWAVISRKTIKGGIGVAPMNPLVAARTAALAMASSRMAAWVAGFYFGLLVWNAPRLETTSGEQRLIVSALNVAASALIAIVALWLESNCRLPEEKDEERQP